MSKDTIYREDAIKAINTKANWYQVTCNGEQIAVMLMAKDVNEILEKMPSADRPQGEWISNHDGSWNCSECGLRVFIYAKGNYCPNCGMKMKGTDDETTT